MSIFSFFKKPKPEPVTTAAPIAALNEWGVLFQTRSLFIYNRYAGTLPNDEGDIVYMKTYPEVPFLNNKLFTNWYFLGFNGIFLQQLSDANATTRSLIFVSFETFEGAIVKTNITAKSWEARVINGYEIEFMFNGATTDVYRLKQNEISFNNPLI